MLERKYGNLPDWSLKMQQTLIEHSVKIPPLGLDGDLVVPEAATGVVLFATAAVVAATAREIVT